MMVATEVVAKAARRWFSAAEKLRVLREADGCTKPGELSALLRREGLYSSHLSAWREARRRGELAGLAPRARGPKPKPVLAEQLIATSCDRQGIAPGRLTVHSDRGPAMTSKSVALLLADLGVTKSHLRPHVANDNPFPHGRPVPKAMPTAVWINPPVNDVARSRAETALTQESRNLVIVRPGASREAVLGADRSQSPDLILEDLCMAVAQ